MRVIINSGHNIDVHESLDTYVRSIVESTLNQVSDHITRVEVHLSDENGPRIGSNDKRCMMEARLAGRRPIAVSHQATTLDHAINGAIHKLARLIRNTRGRLHDIKGYRDDRPPARTL